MLSLIPYLKRYTLGLVAVAIILSAQTLAELYLPTLMADVVNNGMMKGDTAYIWRYGSYMLAVAMLSSFLAIAAVYCAAVIGMGFGRDLRNLVFQRVESFSLHEFDRIGTASLITRTTNDITQMQMVVVMGLRFIVTAPIMCIGGLFMAYSKDPRLTLILAVVLPLMALGIGLVARTAVPLFRAMQAKLDKVNLVLRENLTGIRVIRAFDRQTSETRRFKTANRDLTDTAIRVNKIMAAMNPVMVIFMNLTSIGIIWFGGLRISSGNLLIGDMMAFLQYAMQIMFSIIMVTMMFVMLPRAEASAARINEVLKMAPISLTRLKQRQARTGLVNSRCDLSYPGAENPAISDIGFTARPGQVTAIIGGTGSGKSTLSSDSALLRYHPGAGLG